MFADPSGLNPTSDESMEVNGTTNNSSSPLGPAIPNYCSSNSLDYFIQTPTSDSKNSNHSLPTPTSSKVFSISYEYSKSEFSFQTGSLTIENFSDGFNFNVTFNPSAAFPDEKTTITVIDNTQVVLGLIDAIHTALKLCPTFQEREKLIKIFNEGKFPLEWINASGVRLLENKSLKFFGNQHVDKTMVALQKTSFLQKLANTRWMSSVSNIAKYLGYFSAFLTVVKILVEGPNWKNILDLIFCGISFLGLPGAVIATTYFGLDLIFNFKETFKEEGEQLEKEIRQTNWHELMDNVQKSRIDYYKNHGFK